MAAKPPLLLVRSNIKPVDKFDFSSGLVYTLGTGLGCPRSVKGPARDFLRSRGISLSGSLHSVLSLIAYCFPTIYYPISTNHLAR